MAHNSTENLIQSDSSTSTDELNNGSRSVGKVSKKMLQKKKTAFVGANSVTSPSSSVTSSPLHSHPIIVVGAADVHQPPKPFPRKHLMTSPVDSMATNRKLFTKVDDVVEISVSGESNNSDGKTQSSNREDIELTEIKSQSESSGARSDRMEEPKMFFARSRKNTIVTNIDEVSTKSSGGTSKSSQNESKPQRESKPLPKPRQHIQPQYAIVHEKLSKKRAATPEQRRPSSESAPSEQSKSSSSDSETFTESETKNLKATKEECDAQIDPRTTDNLIDRLVGIYVHSSSELKYDYNVHRPMVRCSIVDCTTGKLVNNSKTNGKVETAQHSDVKNTIQPVMTKGCRFTSSNKFQCQWEQLLMIDENISHIMRGNTIIFFEILDTPSVESKNVFSKFSKITSEWHHVCWGFLKLGDGVNSSNIDTRSCLQLFRYQRRRLFRKCSLNVYDQYRLDRIKYPATLTVTVKGITPAESQFDFSREKGEQTNLAFNETPSQKVLKHTDVENTSIVQSNFLRRLPGQICKYPNTIHQTHLQPSSKGCLVSKFSPNGQFLAYSFNSDYNIQIATVPDLKVINTLRGHTNFVYDLDWLADKRKNSFPLHLVSTSSDRTAVVWTIEKDGISLTILPHPSFLYAAKFLVNLSADECCLFAVTGGRDCTMRVWKVVQDSFDLLQESIEHENYITSIVCATKTSNFYSSDWNGLIVEWSNQKNANSFQVMRKFPKMTEGILALQLHPKNEQRLYAQLKNHQINCLDTSNEIVLNTFGSTDDDRNVNSKFSISPCGSTIYTILWDTIFMHNILTGAQHNFFKVPYVKHRTNSYISHLDYHPKLFLLSVAVYGINGGIVLLSHNSKVCSTEGPMEVVQPDSFDDRWMFLKGNVNPKSSELLGNIIQRIDDILHQPHQPNKNETDDFKNENLNRTHDNGQNVAGGGGYVDVGSLNIVSDSDSDGESGGTFTIRNRSISEISNGTFTLNKVAGDCSNGLQQQQVNDGTYSIEQGDQSDDTTISESM